MRIHIAEDPLSDILLATWDVIRDAAPWMLFGFFAAGVLKALLPDDFVSRHLGPKSRSAVLKAALIGAPIPLCSCGVLPAAAGLRRQGAGKGATAAFLVSTPETGVDSIAVTYALLDPVMAMLRPLAAVLTAMVAGLGVAWLDRHEGRPGTGLWGEGAALGLDARPQEELRDLGAVPSCSGKGCGCAAGPRPKSFRDRMAAGLGYAFGELLADIGPWFLGGAVVAGGLTTLLPPQSLSDLLGTGFWSLLAALAASLPLYVCATATTPLVAALALKGLSPGAALVFLLAGPATNAATIAVVAGMLGRRAAMVYVGAIAICALGLGAVTNALYTRLGLDVSGWVASGDGEAQGLWSTVTAALLLGLMAASWIRARLARR